MAVQRIILGLSFFSLMLFSQTSWASFPLKDGCASAFIQRSEERSQWLAMLETSLFEEKVFAGVQEAFPSSTREDFEVLNDRLLFSESLSKPERLRLALLHLHLNFLPPSSSAHALEQLQLALREVEESLLPEEVVLDHQQETGTKLTRSEIVRLAFLEYQSLDPEKSYAEAQHPRAFSEVIKAPARRYLQEQPDTKPFFKRRGSNEAFVWP